MAAPEEGCEVLSRKSAQGYRKVVLEDGLVVGMLFTGDIEKSGIACNLMKDRVDVSAFKDELLSDDFGLARLRPLTVGEKGGQAGGGASATISGSWPGGNVKC